MNQPYQEIIHAAFCIMEVELGGKSRGLNSVIGAQRKQGTEWLDFAVDLLKFLPEETWKQDRIRDYAECKREECHIVRQFIYSVPLAVWIEGDRIREKV